MERPSSSTHLSTSGASGSPRAAASGETKHEKKHHKSEHKDKEERRAHRKSKAPGSLEGQADPPKQAPAPVRRDAPELGQLISSPAIARVMCDAIDSDQPELALALVELGADPNVLHPVRQATALVVAAERGNAEAIKQLCAAGALQQVAGARETPAEAAQRCNHPQIVRLLQSLRK